MNAIKAKPYPYELPQNAPALIIIDMQRDFVKPDGFSNALGNDMTLLMNVVPNIAKLLDVFRHLNLPVIHTREAHWPDLSVCPLSKRLRGNSRLRIGDSGPMGRPLIDGEPGNDIVAALKPRPGEYDIAKPGKGVSTQPRCMRFCKTPCYASIHRRCYDRSVRANHMREANDRGYECLLVEDATESYFLQFKRCTLDMITAQGGIIGWTAMSSDVIHALEQTYG